MIDKKAKRLFLKYMENESSLNVKAVSYITRQKFIKEEINITTKNYNDKNQTR